MRDYFTETILNDEEWGGTIASKHLNLAIWDEGGDEAIPILNYLLKHPKHLVSPEYCGSVFSIRSGRYFREAKLIKDGLWSLYDTTCIKKVLELRVSSTGTFAGYIAHLVKLGEDEDVLALLRLAHLLRVVDASRLGPSTNSTIHVLFESLESQELGDALLNWSSFKVEQGDEAFETLTTYLNKYSMTKSVPKPDFDKFSFELAVEALEREVNVDAKDLNGLLGRVDPDNVPAYMVRKLLKLVTYRGIQLEATDRLILHPFAHNFVPRALLPLAERIDLWSRRFVSFLREPASGLIASTVERPDTSIQRLRSIPVNLKVASSQGTGPTLWAKEIVRAAGEAREKLFVVDLEDGHLRYTCVKHDPLGLQNFFLGSVVAVVLYGAQLPLLHKSFLNYITLISRGAPSDATEEEEDLIAKNCAPQGCKSSAFFAMTGVAAQVFQQWDIYELYGIQV